MARPVRARSSARVTRTPDFTISIVDAAPPVAPVRHVTVLAGQPPARGRAGPPFLVRVLERLAVEARAARAELMTGGAELGALVRSGVGGAIVGKLRPPDAKPLGAGPGRGPEALMPAHVAGRAHDTPAAARDRRAGWPRARPRSGPAGMLGERGMTDEAGARSRRIAPRHLDELARDARPHAAGVDAAPPVLVLDRMTGPAVPRGQRSLEGRERGGGLAWGAMACASDAPGTAARRRRSVPAPRRCPGPLDHRAGAPGRGGQCQTPPDPAHQPRVARTPARPPRPAPGSPPVVH